MMDESRNAVKSQRMLDYGGSTQHIHTYTVEPLYYGQFGTLILVLITEVSSIQKSLNTLQYYTGTQNGVLIIERSTVYVRTNVHTHHSQMGCNREVHCIRSTNVHTHHSQIHTASHTREVPVWSECLAYITLGSNTGLYTRKCQ